MLLSSVLCLCTLPGSAATDTYLRPEWADSERDPYSIDAANGRARPPVAAQACPAAQGPACN